MFSTTFRNAFVLGTLGVALAAGAMSVGTSPSLPPPTVTSHDSTSDDAQPAPTTATSEQASDSEASDICVWKCVWYWNGWYYEKICHEVCW